MSAAELLGHCLERNLTFAAYRSPGQASTVLIQRDPETSEHRGGSGKAFVVSPFDRSKGPVIAIRPDLVWKEDGIDRFDPLALALFTGNAPVETDDVDHEWDRPGFAYAVERAKEAFTKGTLEKVVLSRKVLRALGSGAIPALFKSATEAFPKAMVALVNCPLYGCWIGASPEGMLSSNNGVVRIDSLAGTQPSDDAQENLSDWGEKEREEQAIVTRSILRSLERPDVRNVRSEEPEVIHAGGVAHLRTVITAEIGSTDPISLANALHPTPAVCGEPRHEAMEFIRGHEPSSRSLYAGYWGPVDTDGSADLFVNIRCMRISGNRGVIHAGAGITSGSDAEAEWNETVLKARTWSDLIEAQRTVR
ncbi:MAG: chorismate-binding protein [Flavobacteriales bacterium]|nr:chorismate-binding protein [Flavobacteriales bacterium]MCC6937358.1 chorismate-binding protein [Flavobacteriales bacterium]